MIGDMAFDRLGDEVPDGAPRGNAIADGGGRDPESRSFDEVKLILETWELLGQPRSRRGGVAFARHDGHPALLEDPARFPPAGQSGEGFG